MNLPEIINKEIQLKEKFPLLSSKEENYILEAIGLFDSGYFSYSLLAIWNAAVNNLKRKVEAYGVELWVSVVKEEPGRKKYNKNGETIAERWSDVDELVLIKGATTLGLLNPKAGKSLEMINWMRNHASPAHDSDNRVEKEDVIGLVQLLQKNLFEQGFPEPGHSISAIFEPIKEKVLTEEELSVFQGHIRSYKQNDIRTAFGFFSDLIANGEEPGFNNSKHLFAEVWVKATEDLRKTLGVKYHNFFIDSDLDESSDKGAKTRIFEILVTLKGVSYIPDGTRAKIFKRAAQKLAQAKDTSYGWSKELSAAKNLVQMGTGVPSVAFEQVYQEILSVWCGNYWGRSSAHKELEEFIHVLNSDKLREILRMFRQNERVRDELFQERPKQRALELLKLVHSKFTIESHKQEAEETYEEIMKL